MTKKSLKHFVLTSTLMVGISSSASLNKIDYATVIATDRQDSTKKYLVTYPTSKRLAIMSILSKQMLDIKEFENNLPSVPSEAVGSDSSEIQTLMNDISALGLDVQIVPVDVMQLSVQGLGKGGG